MTPCPAPPCAGWGRAKAKADAPSRSARTCPAYGPVLARLRPRTFPAYGLTVCKGGSVQGNPRSCPCVLPAPARLRPSPCRLRPNHCAQRRSAQGNPRSCPCVLPAAARLRPCTMPADGRSAARSPRPCPLMGESQCAMGEGEGKGRAPSHSAPHFPRLPPRPCLPTASPPPPKWAPRLRRREGKRPNGAPPHRTAHTPNAARKRYLHNSRTKTQRRTKRCAQFVIFVFTPCKLLHNFSTVLHRSPRNVPESAQIAARRPDFRCFTARFPNVLPESHRAKHPRTAPVLPPKNAPLRAYAKPRPHLRVRGTRQHATTCAFFTFSARYERVGGTRNANFCPAEGRKWGRFRSQMLKNGPQTKKSTFSFGRLVI